VSSIGELFGGTGLEDNETPFDPAALDGALAQVLRDRPPLGEPGGAAPITAPPAPVDTSGEPPASEGGVVQAPVAAPVVDEPVATLPAVPTVEAGVPAVPDDGMTDLERQELAAIRQALADPERALAVRQAYLGVPAAAPPVAPPAPVERPSFAAKPLPEHVDPDSFEAQLWNEQQETQRLLFEQSQATQVQNQATAQERNMAAARTATAAFAARYGDKLTPIEMQAVAQRAAAQKLPEAFLPTTGNNIEEAMNRSLEFVLRSDDALLAKVLGAPAPAPVTALPSGTSPASTERKRSLTALSSAASPGGDAPRAAPITTREDGRIDESSRQSLISQLMAGMNAEREGS